MKHVSFVVMMLCSALLFVWCTKKTPPVEQPVVVDTDTPPIWDNTEKPIDTNSGNVVKGTGDYADEFDENGDYDPKKFQDDDVDAIMDLFEELVSE